MVIDDYRTVGIELHFLTDPSENVTIKPFSDNFPDTIKILFIGIGQSTHTLSWIELLHGKRINLQLFAVPNSCPPAEWPVNTYVFPPEAGRKYSLRKEPIKAVQERIGRFLNLQPHRKYLGRTQKMDVWLKEIIETWRPDLIHTMGLFDDQGGLFYYRCRKKFHLEGQGKWILQLRGGSDIALRKNNPTYSGQIQDIFQECDSIITDNFANIDFIKTSGIDARKIASIAPVPGTGGLDLNAADAALENPPSRRDRIILWPKAYESPWSKALPVFEAFKQCWKEIAPCEVHLLAVNPEAEMWFWDLPVEIREHCHIHNRVDRGQVFELMKHSRVMLAPSLVDGVPNVLYEAMACGAFPIVSPLDTIKPVVTDPKNVLFAHNLSAPEIASALTRAMGDDGLIDAGARENLELVKRIADRRVIAEKLATFYASLVVKS